MVLISVDIGLVDNSVLVKVTGTGQDNEQGELLVEFSASDYTTVVRQIGSGNLFMVSSLFEYLCSVSN